MCAYGTPRRSCGREKQSTRQGARAHVCELSACKHGACFDASRRSIRDHHGTVSGLTNAQVGRAIPGVPVGSRESVLCARCRSRGLPVQRPGLLTAEVGCIDRARRRDLPGTQGAPQPRTSWYAARTRRKDRGKEQARRPPMLLSSAVARHARLHRGDAAKAVALDAVAASAVACLPGPRRRRARARLALVTARGPQAHQAPPTRDRTSARCHRRRRRRGHQRGPRRPGAPRPPARPRAVR